MADPNNNFTVDSLAKKQSLFFGGIFKEISCPLKGEESLFLFILYKKLKIISLSPKKDFH